MINSFYVKYTHKYYYSLTSLTNIYFVVHLNSKCFIDSSYFHIFPFYFFYHITFEKFHFLAIILKF